MHIEVLGGLLGQPCGLCRTGHYVRGDASLVLDEVGPGISVTLSGLPAAVCTACGDAVYPPGLLDLVTRTARQVTAALDALRAVLGIPLSFGCVHTTF